MALSQTLNPEPAPGPPEGPEVGEAAEKAIPDLAEVSRRQGSQRAVQGVGLQT